MTVQSSGAGTNPFGDLGIRYAKAFNDKFAFKLNFSALKGTDWWANDYSDGDTNPINAAVRGENSPSYDGVNVYGDDIVVPVNLAEVAPTVLAGVAEARGMEPGTPEYRNALMELYR